MTFTYNAASITTDLAKVRLMIGDKDSADPLLQDEEINYFLSLNADPTRAAALAARAIAGNFSKLADKSVESVSVKYSQKAEGYFKLANHLESQSALTGRMAGPSATGIRISQIDAANAQSDRPAPDVQKGMFKNPDDVSPRNMNETS